METTGWIIRSLQGKNDPEGVRDGHELYQEFDTNTNGKTQWSGDVMVIASTRKTLTLDEKIEKAQEKLFRAKDIFQATQDGVKRLLEKKKEMSRKEILEVYEKTSRSHEEILRFMPGSDCENDD